MNYFNMNIYYCDHTHTHTPIHTQMKNENTLSASSIIVHQYVKLPPSPHSTARIYILSFYCYTIIETYIVHF
jgi:hypothetical protein